MRFRPKEHIVKEAVPILVHLFHFTKRTRASHVRSAVGLSLSYLTGGSADLALFEDEELRKDRFYELIIPSLSTIINDPAQYGADKIVLDLIAKEFSMLTSLAFSSEQLAQKPKRSEMIRPIAQRGLWKLFADAHIKHLPSDVVSCVLQVMYPPAMLPRSEHPQFVKSLLSTLSSATETKVMVGALRLLEPLFLNRHPAVLDVFIQGDGISSLLRVARLAETGQRRLQLDCIRKICLFIRVVTECFFSDVSVLGTVQATKDDQLDYIFQSEFLMTLNQVVTVRGWWLPEVADIWMPALLELCKIRPGEAVWQIVVPTLRKFAEANEGKQGCLQLMSDLENMQMLITPTDSESGEE
ncbi:hypothetical protein CPC08DRAFT_746373 [Agrocybe pediades]|nr:hypothetical protein CPC08DRAFT_746373 [Agrocybe pediades]